MTKAIKSKYKNLCACVRGGAADGLGYARMLLEWLRKEVHFAVLAGSSAGGIVSALYAVGMSFIAMVLFLLAFPGDRTMRMEARLERRKNWLMKIIRGIAVFVATRTYIYPKLKKLFKKHLSWERVKKAGRVDRLLIGFYPQELMAHARGSAKISGFRDTAAHFKAEWGEIQQWLKDFAFMMYGDADGVWAFIPKASKKKLIKISDDVIPLDVLIRSTFWNPVFPDIKLKFRLRPEVKKYFPKALRNETEWEPFDGGICDNQAITAMIGQKDFHCFVCDTKIPKTLPQLKKQGKKIRLSDVYFGFNPPKPSRVHFSPPKKDHTFFEFDDISVLIECFKNATMSAIKKWRDKKIKLNYFIPINPANFLK